MNNRIKKKIQKRLGYKVYRNYRYARIESFVKELMKRSEFNPERDITYVKVTENAKHVVRFYILKNVEMRSDIQTMVEDTNAYNIYFRSLPLEDNPLADRLLTIHKNGRISSKEGK